MFYEILLNLCSENSTTITAMLKELKLSTSKGTAWKGGSVPSGNILKQIADHFNVSTDYLLGKTNNPAPPDSNITFDDFTFAFYEESKTLSEEDKENLLDMARIFNQRRKERQKKDGE